MGLLRRPVVSVVLLCIVMSATAANAETAPANRSADALLTDAAIRYMAAVGYSQTIAEAHRSTSDAGPAGLPFPPVVIASGLRRGVPGWSAAEAESVLVVLLHGSGREAVAQLLVADAARFSDWTLVSAIITAAVEGAGASEDAAVGLAMHVQSAMQVLGRAAAELDAGHHDPASHRAIIAAARIAEARPSVAAAEFLREIARLTRDRSLSAEARARARAIASALRNGV